MQAAKGTRVSLTRVREAFIASHPESLRTRRLPALLRSVTTGAASGRALPLRAYASVTGTSLILLVR